MVEAVTAAASTIPDTLFAPAGTTMPAGTVNARLLLESMTVEPPVGAAALRVTVRISAPLPFAAACEIAMEVRLGRTAGVSVRLAVFVPPLYFAVTVTAVEAETPELITFTLAEL